MSFMNKIIGQATIETLEASKDRIAPYLLEDEEVIMGFSFLRDSIILTTAGVYCINVQNITGKKVEVKFFPSKSIKYISIESAGVMDLDADVKIGVDGNTVVTQTVAYNAPLSFKIPKNQHEEAKELIRLIKKHCLTKN